MPLPTLTPLDNEVSTKESVTVAESLLWKGLLLGSEIGGETEGNGSGQDAGPDSDSSCTGSMH